MFWSLHLHFHGQLLIWSARHLGTQSSVGFMGNKTPRGTERGFLPSGRSRFSFSHRAVSKHRVELYKYLYQKYREEEAGMREQQEEAVPAPASYFQEAESGIHCQWRAQTMQIFIGSACPHFLHCFLSSVCVLVSTAHLMQLLRSAGF